MHEAAIAKLASQVGGILRNCLVQDGWPVFDSVSERLDALAVQLIKQKPGYLNTSDVFSIFYDMVPAAVRAANQADAKPSGRLLEVLPDEASSSLETGLLKYFQSVPRDYEVLLPLPTSNLSLDSVEFAQGIGLRVDKNVSETPQLGLMAAFSRTWKAEVLSGVPYLYCGAHGYVRDSLDNQTARSALSTLKIMLQQGMFRGLLTNDRRSISPTAMLMGPPTHYSVAKARLICVDRSPEPRSNFYVDLPLDVSKLIERITFSSGNKTLTAAAGNGVLSTVLVELFRLPALLAADSSSESIRVRAASEWCFDSYASESETLAFLQVCIGLEALFGEEAENESLTKSLADRCAYLLGTSVKSRASIRDSFRALYKARSKIVHGNALSLADGDRRYMEWGRNILEYAIAKELKYLGLEKN